MGLIALLHKFDVVSESFLFFKIRAIFWKICVKTCGDIHMNKIVDQVQPFSSIESKVIEKNICVCHWVGTKMSLFL